jgi:glycerol kinase
VVQWLRDGLHVIHASEDVESLALSVPDSGDVYFVPAFTGLGAPHWDPHARGMLVGLTRGTTSGHIARAALESIAFQTADLLDALLQDSRLEVKQLRVDGGAAKDDTLLQFQADLLGFPVIRPAIIETTSLGAAYLAGLAVGFWANQEEIEHHWKVDQEFHPKRSRDEMQSLRHRWTEAIKRSRDWARSAA